MNNFQRVGSISNAHVGRDFEKLAYKYFQVNGIKLNQKHDIPISISNYKKNHTFDLGINSNESEKIIVECNSHRWTAGGYVPSAKLTVWNEAMYYFLLAPEEYRKIFFILRNYSIKHGKTLGEYYLRKYNHLIPEDVEFFEYNEENHSVKIIKGLNDQKILK